MDDADIAAILEADASATVAATDEFENLFGESDDGSVDDGAPRIDPDPGLMAPAEKGGVRRGRRKKGGKKKAKRRRNRKRARMLALSGDDELLISSSGSEEAGPVKSKKRRRILCTSSDDGMFAREEASAPMSSSDDDADSLTLGDLLDLGEARPPGGGRAGRRRFADDEAEEASDEEGAATRKGKKAGESGNNGDEIAMDVRAHEFVSAHPPTMIFKSGKTSATTVYVTLAGDLVRDMSCPLHTFRVRARRIPGSVSDSGEPVLGVLDIEKVIAGPVVDASKSAMAEALKINSAMVGDGVVRVTVSRLKRAITSSDYLKNVQNKAAYASKLFARLLEEFPGQAFLTSAALERFAPADGNGRISWMCRNALEDARFFRAANCVGGAAVRAIGRPAAGTQPMWDAINGVSGAVAGIGGRGAVVDLLKKIHFANQLSEFRAARLHEALDVPAEGELADEVACIVCAAAVVHSLPATSDVQDDRYRNAIVRSEPYEVWPEPMLRLLRWHGLHVDKDEMQRWYACRQQTRQFYSGVVESMRAGTVRFVRAEADDDHEVAGDSGYVERLRDCVSGFKHNLLVISKTEARVRYLEYHTKGYGAKFMKFHAFFGRAFAPGENTVIWIDRANSLNASELTWMLTTWSSVAKAIYLAGSTWAGTTRYESTLFSQLFAGASNDNRETLTATLADYKTAPVGSNPLAEGALNGTVPTIIGRLSASRPPAVMEAFPHTRSYSVAQLAEAVDVRPRALLVLYDNGWTREDLATVWQHAPPKPNAIWMLGGADWHPALGRSSRSNAGSAALIQKAARVG